jgi:hypothetical protein
MRQKPKNRVMAQPVMVVDVLVSQGGRRDALPDQRVRTVDRASRSAASTKHAAIRSNRPMTLSKCEAKARRHPR